MIQHFKNIEYLYGKKASIQMPNGIFRELSACIKNSSENANSQQVSFAYAYLISIAFLYKYTNFVDLDNGTYIQNSDLKEVLGYSKETKSINRIIAKDGILEKMGLVETTKDFPVRHYLDRSDDLDGLPLWSFILKSEIDERDILYEAIKKTVKNRNYEIREPLFLTTGYKDNDYGTLYSLPRTHEITIHEFVQLLSNEETNNIDIMLYGYLKSKCKGYRYNAKDLSLQKILGETGLDSKSFYRHLDILKRHLYINVRHGKWRMKNPDRFIRMESNRYYWKGVS